MHACMARAYFITFEGIDGCGKSTAAAGACEFLKNAGRNAILTREPGGTRLGESIRRVLLDLPEGISLTPAEEALLFSASRAVHTREIVRPALSGGTDVICDRYYDSTFAYQGVAGGLSDAELGALAEIATGGLSPDLTLLLDLPVETAQDRRMSAGGMTRIDRKDAHYHSEVRERFLMLAKRHPERIRVIDSSGERENTMELVAFAIKEFLKTAESESGAGGAVRW